MPRRLKRTLCLLGLIVVIGCESTRGPTAPDADFRIDPASPVTSTMGTASSSHALLDDLVENDVPLEPEVDPEEGDTCVRSPGFYCQNQGGKNPNMTEEEFALFAAEAASLLAAVDGLDTPEAIAGAVCDTSDQLFRHLATLALNLASGRVDDTEPHDNPLFPTVGAAFDHAVSIASDPDVSREDRKEVKRMIEQVNELVSIDEDETCEVTEDEDDGESSETGTVPACTAFDPEQTSKILICHKGKNTLSVSVSAWPAHYGHGDTCGPCP